ncbi:MAG: ArsA family ATPase [Ferrimicrobium sp.]|uniref:ArsA family ATPase n=1 Tax=Ferrimicrobium acidiphilum TaxID=121039 RepID=A0ABV3Y2S6_9ACTN|nr:ArsA-related P-loop ATPase [Ferrimicrobium sp.]MCL5973239.1 AAA family ATPase [Actinomycetota bacterium]
MNLLDAIGTKETLVCIGPGGVGKTTSAAAVGLMLANTGRKVCVLTIDPARRLASALGLDRVDNEPVLASEDLPNYWVAMLDPKQTFDAMIRRYSSSSQQEDEIIANPVYRNLVTRLSGTQEYMAFERLWELRESQRFDTIIVDTPPAQAAIDFLHAPSRLAGFLDNRIFKFMLKPPPLYLRPIAMATRGLIKQIASVVGAEVVNDTMSFFQAFSGIEDGFRERALMTSELLASQATSYLLVSSPASDALAAGSRMVGLLRGIGHQVDSVLVNRMTPTYAAYPRDPGAPPEAKEDLMRLTQMRTHQQLVIDGWGKELGLEGWYYLEDLATDVSNLAALAEVAAAMEQCTLVPFQVAE